MYTGIFSLAVLFGAVSCVYYDYAPVYNALPTGPAPSCELGSQLSYLPMFVVPKRELTLLEYYNTQYNAPAPALVQFVGQEYPLPAVRVVLSEPIPITSWQSYLEFPSTFTILQDGYRLPFPVSAIYAPISDYQYIRQPYIDVVYAVPSMPKPPKTMPTTTVKPSTQNITVLHFPESLAQPQVLFHVQDDDELGGRNPPIPVIPAGIVQSSAPTPGITTFINSKESPVLQALRDMSSNRFKSVRTYG